MHHILILGAGHIGSLISTMLAYSNDYLVFLGDIQEDTPHLHRLRSLPNFQHVQLNATDPDAISEFVKQNGIMTIVSALPYYCNVPIAALAEQLHTNYFDLTEDVKTTAAIKEIAKRSKGTFVTQCGLAPGFISIVANDLMKHFPTLDSVKMRVGALPTNVSNALQYSLTWSTDGLINEYGNGCPAVRNGQEVMLSPLEDLEEIKIDGLTYEAFNTSGGIGSLAHTYFGKIRQLSYKTIRYPGHCERIKFLMNDLKLNEDRPALKRILEHALPKTYQDVVLVYVSVSGYKEDMFIEEHYVKKFYPQELHQLKWSAIQMTTASGICAAIDLVINHPDKYHGFVRQEQFSLETLVNNQFGKYYA